MSVLFRLCRLACAWPMGLFCSTQSGSGHGAIWTAQVPEQSANRGEIAAASAAPALQDSLNALPPALAGLIAHLFDVRLQDDMVAGVLTSLNFPTMANFDGSYFWDAKDKPNALWVV